jgi:hypothetical protein
LCNQRFFYSACRDGVDCEIIQLLNEVGYPGLLPKDLQEKLQQFTMTRHQISPRILRINKCLEGEFCERFVEKRGWPWALTSFVLEVWRESEKRTDSLASNLKRLKASGSIFSNTRLENAMLTGCLRNVT